MMTKFSPWFLLAGYPILLWWHLSSLLARPYYQFVIVVPILVFALLQRGRDNRTSVPGDYRWSWLVIAALATALALLAAATWKWSPWGGMLSCLIAVFSLFWLQTGWSGVSRWLPAWVMCWILLPLPFGWDERLTVGLRGVTTQLTSRVLDQFGTLHVSYMNVIQVPAKSLFIADACSGVHSLYVLIAASLFWALYNRRTILQTVLLVFGAFGMVLFENITRLTVIVLALGWKMDLSAGTNHLLLGLLLFMLSAGLIISLDQLLLFLLPRRAPLSDDPLGKRTAKVRVESVPNDIPPRIWRGTSVLVALFVFCGFAQWFLKPGALPDLTASFQTPPTLPEMGEDGMPKELGGFSRLEYKHIQRVVGDPFGQESQQWLYGSEPLLVQVSVDYPYDGYHDPRLCYSQIGWQVDSAEVRSASLPQQDSAKPVAADAPVAIIRMTRPLEGEAILMFSQFDWGGRITARLPDRSGVPQLGDAQRRLSALLARPTKSTEAPAQLPLTQVQLLARSAEPMTPDHINRMVRFYHEFRNRVLEQVLQGQTDSKGAGKTLAAPNSLK